MPKSGKFQRRGASAVSTGNFGKRGGRSYDNNKRGYKRFQYNDGQMKKKQKIGVGNRLKETDVGVTEYVSNHVGFSGVVKERYVDFQVNEINLDGEIAKLTDQSIPPEPENLESLDDLKKEIPSAIWDQLEMLIEADSMITSVDINVTNIGKEERRAIHAVAKKIPNTISQTIEKDKEKLIVVAKARKNKSTGHKFRKDKRVDWGRRGGNYCHFLLHKVNMDTMDALNQIAMFLRIKSDMFNYAGTKDRRARTTQWVSVKKVNPGDILSASRAVRGAFVGNFKFAKEPLRLGLLNGNRFTIALRNVTGSDEEIDNAMKSLRDNGFINYYGLQRFGTVAAIPTHEIGKALLRGEWNEAIDLILKPRLDEQQSDLVAAREIYQQTKDPLEAYQKIGRSDRIEAKLLWGLHICGCNNPQGALDWVPRNTSLMYIHAYQSYVWNIMVSKRIKDLGRKAVIGDLVYEDPNFIEEKDELEYCQNNDAEDQRVTNQKDDAALADDKGIESPIERTVRSETEMNIIETNVGSELNVETKECNIRDLDGSAQLDDDMNGHGDVDTRDTEKCDERDPDKTDGNKEADRQNTKKDDARPLPRVKILSAEDLPKYTLADVIMPQPGWRVTYPPYAKPWFDEILAKDGLTADLRQKNKRYTLGGAYRKILEVPSDISWKVMRYTDRNHEFILTDIDEKKKPEPKEDPEGKYKALIIEMSLRPSTYATMALREILKCDTSSETQANQSAANKALADEEEKQISIKSEMEQDDASDNISSVDKNLTMDVVLKPEKPETE